MGEYVQRLGLLWQLFNSGFCDRTLGTENMKDSSSLRVVVTRKLPAVIEVRLAELFDMRFNVQDKPMGRDELLEAVQNADVLIPTVTDIIDEGLLCQAGEQLKLIANFGAGTDHINIEAAYRQNITVTSTPDVLTQDTADMTLALMLAVPRRLAEGAQLLKERKGQWAGWSPTWMLGHRICSKRLGILGMGRIGQAVAHRAKAFNLQINYHNRHRVPDSIEQELGATYWESLDQMLAHIDILSVNCPYTPATYHLLSTRRLRLLNKNAYIINTSRGEIIDENAMAKMLVNGELAGAGLDVFEHEPAINPLLLKAPNVIALPHMGSATIEARNDMGDGVIVNIKAFLDGYSPPGQVLPRG